MGFINQLTSLGGLTLYESLLILGMITYGDPRSRYGLGIWKIHSHGWTTPILHIAMVSFPISTLIHVYILHRFSWFICPMSYIGSTTYHIFHLQDDWPPIPSRPMSPASTRMRSRWSSSWRGRQRGFSHGMYGEKLDFIDNNLVFYG